MTKHDPAEIEAVAEAIHASECAIWNDPEGWDDTDLKHIYRTQASDAISALDAHRAPAIRAAVDNYRANVEANVQWGPGENGILQRAEDSSYRELLAICGIDEQENA